jgi:hypothetical protein
MTTGGEGAHRAVFIVRLDNDDGGRVVGTVERVRTGAKARIEGLEGLAEILALMLASEEQGGWQ